MNAHRSSCLWRKGKAREFQDRGNHGCSVVKAIVHDEHEIGYTFVFLHLVAEDARVHG